MPSNVSNGKTLFVVCSYGNVFNYHLTSPYEHPTAFTVETLDDKGVSYCFLHDYLPLQRRIIDMLVTSKLNAGPTRRLLYFGPLLTKHGICKSCNQYLNYVIYTCGKINRCEEPILEQQCYFDKTPGIKPEY